MLSLHTNSAVLAIENALNRASTAQNTSQIRLGTGYRINSASDDAAGLQISTRLEAGTSGMYVAAQNTQNGISLMQTADGAFNEMVNIVNRMKDLATQAADDSMSADDKQALQAEYDSLGKELYNEMNNTTYAGQKLFQKADAKAGGGAAAANTGLFAKTGGITFQIGATSQETMVVDLSDKLDKISTQFNSLSSKYSGAAAKKDPAKATTDTPGKEIATTADANKEITTLNQTIDLIGAMRAGLGAAENRLTHVNNNLTNMSSNTTDADGRIRDANYAVEASNNQRASMLTQTGVLMLKQANQISGHVLSLLQ